MVNPDFELFVVNAYLNNYRQKKKYMKNMNEWLIKFRINKPQAGIMVCGDFNTCIKPI